MNLSANNSRFLILALVVFVVALSRLIAPAYGLTGFLNFSPVGALALFGGAYFGRKYLGFVLPFLALWLSNILLDNLFYAKYYDGFTWFSNWEIYFAFALIVGLGALLLKKITALRLLAGSLSASVLFFIVTNFFVWKTGTMYSHDFAGLITCYVAAIPFFWNTLLGDLFYVAVLFGAFEWAQRKVPALQIAK